eukprot:gene13451-14832_t
MAESSESSKERFKWKTGDKIANLIQCLAAYKSQMEFNNSDFNADKVKQYEAIQLKLIWGGSPATKPLSVGISSDMVNNDTSNSSSESILETKETYDADGDETGESNMRKRKVMENPAPKLIDNKRRHMERQLSAAQRDQLLLNEAKEDSQFKRDIAEGMRQSNQTFAESIQNISHSIMQVAQGLTRSIEVMSQALVQSNAGHYSGHGLDRNQPTASGFDSRGFDSCSKLQLLFSNKQ